MTYRDFIAECEMYHHSAEHFNLMKECSELELTAKFMEDQIFMAENASIIGGAIALSEGYFQESVDENTIEVMTEKFNYKAVNIREKIYNGLKKIIGVFMNFFRKVENKFDTLTDSGQQCREKLATMDIDENDLKEIQKIITSAKSKDGSFPVAAKQPYLNKIKLGKVASSDKSYIVIKNDLAAALSNTTVVADVSNFSDAAFSAEEIEDAVVRLGLNYKDMKLSNITGILATLTAAFKNNKINGITIKVNTKEIANHADILQKLSDEISEIGRNIENKALASNKAVSSVVNAGINLGSKMVNNNSTNDDSQEEGKTNSLRSNSDIAASTMAEITSKLNSAYSLITKGIGSSIKLYTGLNSYRSSVINGLESFIKSKSDKKDEKKDEKKDN